MEKQKTIATTTIVGASTEAEADFICEKAKEFSDGEVQVLSTRQIASNYYEVQMYLADVTDLYLIGLAVGRKFPLINNF